MPYSTGALLPHRRQVFRLRQLTNPQEQAQSPGIGLAGFGGRPPPVPMIDELSAEFAGIPTIPSAEVPVEPVIVMMFPYGLVGPPNDADEGENEGP